MKGLLALMVTSIVAVAPASAKDNTGIKIAPPMDASCHPVDSGSEKVGFSLHLATTQGTTDMIIRSLPEKRFPYSTTLIFKDVSTDLLPGISDRSGGKSDEVVLFSSGSTKARGKKYEFSIFQESTSRVFNSLSLNLGPPKFQTKYYCAMFVAGKAPEAFK